jgi:uncharacterized protein involved in exopolysaccharide biosynthesis
MSHPGEQKQSGDVSIVGVAVVLLRRRRIIVLVTLLAVVLAVAAGFLARRTYTASASFMPQSTDKTLSRLAGLAAQFGVPTLSGAGQSPDFFADVITSRQLLSDVADTRFTLSDSEGTRTGQLADFLKITEPLPEIRRERAVDALRTRVGAVTDAKTGLVEVTARMPDPALAEQVLKRMLELLNDFNLRTRQSQARAERIFVEGRVAEVQGDLRQAENRLQAFLQRNRDFFNSPQLKFEEERLQREVTMRQEIYTNLAQSYEQSRIDEVRDTPVITIVESAYRPVEPDSRRIIVRAVVALLLGGMLGVLLAFFREFARNRREAGDATFHDLVALRRQAAADLRRPWRLLRPTGS